MDINQITVELDALFAQERIGEIPRFLESHIAQAIKEGARDVALTLYNEIIGFYRETGQYGLSIENCHKALTLMDEMGIQDTIPYATTLLNTANAHRAAGLLPESLEFYNRVKPIYVARLKEDDMYFVSFYNNLSLLYQEMGDFASAKEQLENALYIVNHKEDKQFEVAVTQANLANTCIELGQDDEAKARAEEAIRIFEEIGVDDAHYSAALSALGSLYYMDKDYTNALEVMEKGRDCVAKYLGTDNIQYRRLSDNIAIIKGKLEEYGEVLGIMDDNFTVPGDEEAYGEGRYEEGTYEGGNYGEGTDDVGNYEEGTYGDDSYEEGTYEGDNYEEGTYGKGNYGEGTDDVGNYEEGTYEGDNCEEGSYGDGNYEEEAYGEDNYEEEPYGEGNYEGTDDVGNYEEGTYEGDNYGEGPYGAEDYGEEPYGETACEAEEPDVKGLELCRCYYENYGKPMIAEKFRAYEHVIATGLVGKGSDCFGFDDMQSRDHDFGPRFFLWVTKRVYDEIGEELQREYEKLPDEYMGVKRIETFHGRDRSGVMIIEEFYKNVLGHDIGTLVQGGVMHGGKESLGTIKSWLAIHDYALAAAVNGEVFRDDEGIFTQYRERLMAYYPKAVWYRKIAQTCALFSQSGQYNLPRMRGRGQFVAAELAKAECVRQAMKLYYLFNRKYAPHDKWLFRGMDMNIAMMAFDEDRKVWGVPELVEKISLLPADKAHEQELSTAVEMLAVIFANELERKNMVGQCDLYLDASTKELTSKSDALLTAIVADTPVITALSLSIAKAEFEAFDKLKNAGGRASGQNNWPTFKIMRMSQYMTWTEDMLLQYMYEFRTNYENGRNMVEEKYARMMESTAPLEYAGFADRLQPVSGEKKAVTEQIIGLHVNWMEEFARAYPNLADNAQVIHSYEDMPYDTPYETYLRGELGTYSDRMLEMYGRHVVECARGGHNLVRDIMENTVRFYGYSDLESANRNGIS